MKFRESVPYVAAKIREKRLSRKPIEYSLEHVNHHHGQDDYVLYAHKWNMLHMGHLKFSTYRGDTHVQMLHVDPKFRRQGVGSGLIRELHFRHKKELEQTGKIHYGYSTEEGNALLKSGKVPFGKNRIKTEDIDRTGYKIDQIHTHPVKGNNPGRKKTVYVFRHAGGPGYVEIVHGGDWRDGHTHPESHISFDTLHDDPSPAANHRNAARILKTVAKAVRHHLMKEKPKHIGYFAMSDTHDDTREGNGRRDKIYGHMLKKTLLKRGWKKSQHSWSNRVHLEKP